MIIDRKKFFVIYGTALVISFALIMVFLLVEAYSSKIFTEAMHISTEKDPSCEIEVAPRAGDAGTWSKRVEKTTLKGRVYDIYCKNIGDYTVADWNMRVNILQKCYINSAWCGEVEIHQFRDGAELSQRLDLREMEEADIEVEFVVSDSDILLPLEVGDYLIYYPNEEVFENPIEPRNGSANIGFIFYDYDKEMDFSDSVMYYYLGREMLSGTAKAVFYTLIWLWCVALVSFVTMLLTERVNNLRLSAKEKRIEESLSVFTCFVDAKDNYTNGHSTRVAEYSEKIAGALGYSDTECRNVYYIGLMHDCGKVYIDDSILKKPGKLTKTEYEDIKLHTIRGAMLLEKFESIDGIREGAMYHHERYDGTGYPSGKKGEEIPEIGRIIAVADAYDAMSSERVYRSPLTEEKTLEELKNGRGTQFDPRILDVFLELLDQGKI